MATIESIPSKTKLTDKFIQALPPAPAGKRYIVMDTVENGFGICVTEHGHKSFQVIKRIRGGGPVKYVIKPAYPTMSLAAAREKAVAVKIELSNGVNPRDRERAEDEARRVEKDEADRTSFDTVAEAWLSKHVIGTDPADPNLRSSKMIEDHVRKNLLTCSWAKLPITKVTDDHILAMMRATMNDPKRKRKPGQRCNAAARSFDLCRQIFKWALKKKYGLKANPCDCIDIDEEVGEKNGSRERILDDDELRIFWRACGDLEFPAGSALRFLFLTACRLNEVMRAEWTEFSNIDGTDSISGPVLIVPAVRMKGRKRKAVEHVIPIVPAMSDVLTTVPKFVGGRFVFSYSGGRAPISAMTRLKQTIDGAILRVIREDLGLPKGAKVPEQDQMKHWTFHDLRRTARSLLGRAGVSEDIAERCAAHKVGSSISQVYNRYRYLPEKRDAFERLAALVGRILSQTSNVVELRRVESA